MIDHDDLLLALNELESIVVVSDIDGKIKYVNNAFEKKYGFTKEEVIGKKANVLKSGFHNESYYSEMWRTILNGETWEGTLLNKAKNGRLIWELAKISPIFKNNKLEGFIAVKEDITYKKEQEEQFQKDKFLLDQLFDNAPFGIIILKTIKEGDGDDAKDLLVVKSNPVAGEIFKRLGLVGLKLSFFFPDFIQSTKQGESMLLYKQEFESFYQSLGKYLRLITFPLDNDRFCMFIHDVTDYRKSIRALKESEERYTKLVEDAPALIKRFDKHGIISYANGYYSRYINKEVNALVGTNLYDLFTSEQRRLFLDKLSSLSVSNPIFEYRQNETRYGNELWIKWVVRALFDVYGDVLEYQAVGMDFTNLIKTERLLEEQKNRLTAILDNAIMGIGVMNYNGEFLSSNNRLVEMMECDSMEQFLTMNYFDFAIYDKQDTIVENLRNIFRGESSHFNIQRKYRTKKGREFWGDMYATPIVVKGGQVKEVVGMVVDITDKKKIEDELKQNEEQLRALNVTKDKLFSIIAHDIRNPFNIIMGFSTLLEQAIDDLEKEEIRSLAHKIVEASNDTFKLLEDLLTWAKSQLGQLKVHNEKFRPCTVIDECVTSLSATAKSKHIKLKYDIEKDVELFSDVAMFKFVIRNLLHNAIKFSYSDQKVECKMHVSNDHVAFTIRDYGVGIRPEKLEKLFDLSETIASYGTANEKGTGLGLSMCKEMVELNKGELKVESEVGKGSRFIVVLPLNQE